MRTLKFIVSILVLSYSTNLLGQSSFAPLNAFWNYGYGSHDGSLMSNWTIKVTQDTLINGFETKTLMKYYDNWFSMPPNPPPTEGDEQFGTIQVRNDSVFYYYIFPFGEMFLFSFAMNTGDTIPISQSPQGLIAVVDTMYTIIINNDTLKQWELTKYCDTTYFGNATIVEKIGPIDDYLLWNQDGCPIGGGGWNFQCYSSTDINYNQPCAPIVIGIETTVIIKTNLSIYPNPANGVFILITNQPISDVAVSIFDSKMQVVISKIYKNFKSEVLDLSALPAGQYIMQFKSGEFSVVQTIVKVN